MKTVALWALLIVLAAGCATGNYRRGDTASRSLRQAAREVAAENQAVENTLTALDNLISTRSGDLKPQFQAFSRSLETLKQAATRTDQAGAVMVRKHRDYFAEWERQLAEINFEAVRNSSAARREQVSANFEATSQLFLEDQTTMGPLIRYFEDLRTALSNDLTQEGLQSVAHMAANARTNSAKVQTALSRLHENLTTSGSRMATVILEASR